MWLESWGCRWSTVDCERRKHEPPPEDVKDAGSTRLRLDLITVRLVRSERNKEIARHCIAGVLPAWDICGKEVHFLHVGISAQRQLLYHMHMSSHRECLRSSQQPSVPAVSGTGKVLPSGGEEARGDPWEETNPSIYFVDLDPRHYFCLCGIMVIEWSRNRSFT